MDEPSIDPWWGEPGLSVAEKVYAWNTFEILAFRTGNPDNPVNAIPGMATAVCQVRFVAGTDPESLMPALRRHLDAQGFDMVMHPAGPQELHGCDAARSGWTTPGVQWAVASVERSLGARPAILPNIGGSLPNDCFALGAGSAAMDPGTASLPGLQPACTRRTRARARSCARGCR